MNARTLWQEICEDIRSDRRNGRPVSPEEMSLVDEHDALRYVRENDEGVTQLLAETIAEVIEKPSALKEIDSLIGEVMERGEDMSGAHLTRFAELLQRHMTQSVRGRIARRIDREVL